MLQDFTLQDVNKRMDPCLVNLPPIRLFFHTIFEIFDRKVSLFMPDGTQPAKIDLNKKSFPKQKTIQNFTIDAQGFRKTKNENPPTWEMGVTS